MGKRLKTQRRGKGGFVYKAAFNGMEAVYSTYSEAQKEEVIAGYVVDLIKVSGRSPILAEIIFDGNQKTVTVAAEGMQLGQNIMYGKNADIEIGNVLPLEQIPEGCPIFNIEKTPGDGGQLVRSGGLYALLVTKDKKFAYIKLPSGKTKSFNLGSRATIGCVTCGGRKEKPFVKAGNKFYFMKSKGKRYPTVRGVAMNAYDHPHGGEQHHVGKSKSVPRKAPPGRKVGAIASKRTGRKKKH